MYIPVWALVVIFFCIAATLRSKEETEERHDALLDELEDLRKNRFY